MKLPFVLSNGHPLVNIDGKWFLVDSGSPFSFRFDGIREPIRVGEKLFSVAPPWASRSTTEALAGHSVDGFLGIDLFHQFGQVTFCPGSGELFLGESVDAANASVIPFRTGVAPSAILIPAQILDEPAELLFDTGSFLDYISPAFTHGLQPEYSERDYSPRCGYMDVNGYCIPIVLGCKNTCAPAFAATQVVLDDISALRVQGVLGIGRFCGDGGFLCVDYANRQLIFHINRYR